MTGAAPLILCSGTLGHVPFLEKARAAAAAGFDGISIYVDEYEPGLRPRLDDLGLGVAEVDGALAWLPGSRGTDVGRALDVAAELGGRSLTALELTGAPPDLDEAATAFADLCDRAAAYGLGVHIEPFAWSGIATMAAAHEIVTRADRANGGIILDTWHLARGPDAGRLDAAVIPAIVAVQLADPSPDPTGLTLRDECMTSRRLPGACAAAIVAHLPPGLPREVEVFGLGAGRDVDVDDAARTALHALRTFESGSRGTR